MYQKGISIPKIFLFIFRVLVKKKQTSLSSNKSAFDFCVVRVV